MESLQALRLQAVIAHRVTSADARAVAAAPRTRLQWDQRSHGAQPPQKESLFFFLSTASPGWAPAIAGHRTQLEPFFVCTCMSGEGTCHCRHPDAAPKVWLRGRGGAGVLSRCCRLSSMSSARKCCGSDGTHTSLASLESGSDRWRRQIASIGAGVLLPGPTFPAEATCQHPVSVRCLQRTQCSSKLS